MAHVTMPAVVDIDVFIDAWQGGKHGFAGLAACQILAMIRYELFFRLQMRRLKGMAIVIFLI